MQETDEDERLDIAAARAIVLQCIQSCDDRTRGLARQVDLAATRISAANLRADEVTIGRQALEEARKSLRVHDSSPVRLKRIPILSAFVVRRRAAWRSQITIQIETQAAALMEVEHRYLKVVRADARSRALNAVREEVGRLRSARKRLVHLKSLIDEFPSNRPIAIPKPRKVGNNWFGMLEALLVKPHQLPLVPTVTPINNGKDNSELNLKNRSHVVPLASVVGGDIHKLSTTDRWYLHPSNKAPEGVAGFRLLSEFSSKPPIGLFEERARVGVPLLPGSYGGKERLYLPAPVDCVDEIIAAGGSMGKRGGFFIDPAKIDGGGDIARFLPFIAQKHYLPLMAELIPKTSWGSSLANLLTPSSWGELRRSVTSRFGGLCQICGQLKNGHSIECHEVWEYDNAVEHRGMKVQRLVGLASVCKACHGVFHLGFSKMRGHGDQAAYRLADINGWSMAELEQAEVWMQENFEARSRCEWALDLNLVATDRPVVVDKSKWSEDEFGNLRSSANGQRTSLIGIRYKLGARGVERSDVVPPRRAYA